MDFSEPQSAPTEPPPSAPIDAEIVSNKIHIRGLDDLTTKHIQTFSLEHFPEHSPKVEWIDDTSANLVYDDPQVTSDALRALSLVPDDSSNLQPLFLRPAKPISSHPASNLSVRVSVATDRKAPRAREKSRFYLLHPDLDPQERRRREHKIDSRRRGDQRGRASRNSRSDSSSPSRADDHRPERRSRSASPARSRGDRSRRRRTPPPRYSRHDPNPDSNAGKELFPTRSGKVVGKELFRNKSKASTLKNELFPEKVRAGKTAGTFDADTADLFANRLSVPFVDGGNDEPNAGGEFPLRSDTMSKAVRQTHPEKVVADSGSAGRGDSEGAGGFTIKGRGGADSGERGGLSIKGNAGIQIRGTAMRSEDRVKELFPAKVGNQGKELFKEKNRADMFY